MPPILSRKDDLVPSPRSNIAMDLDNTGLKSNAPNASAALQPITLHLPFRVVDGNVD